MQVVRHDDGAEALAGKRPRAAVLEVRLHELHPGYRLPLPIHRDTARLRSAKKRACLPAPLATSSTGPCLTRAAQRTTHDEGASRAVRHVARGAS